MPLDTLVTFQAVRCTILLRMLLLRRLTNPPKNDDAEFDGEAALLIRRYLRLADFFLRRKSTIAVERRNAEIENKSAA